MVTTAFHDHHTFAVERFGIVRSSKDLGRSWAGGGSREGRPGAGSSALSACEGQQELSLSTAESVTSMMGTGNDSWDLETSVGATATLVASARARATNCDPPRSDDRFAEPLVRAVGIELLSRWASGDLEPSEVDVPGAPWGLERLTITKRGISAG